MATDARSLPRSSLVPPSSLPTATRQLQLRPEVQRRVRDPAGVALEIQALEVASLSKVNPGSTKVIVMDAQVGCR